MKNVLSPQADFIMWDHIKEYQQEIPQLENQEIVSIFTNKK